MMTEDIAESGYSVAAPAYERYEVRDIPQTAFTGVWDFEKRAFVRTESGNLYAVDDVSCAMWVAKQLNYDRHHNR